MWKKHLKLRFNFSTFKVAKNVFTILLKIFNINEKKERENMDTEVSCMQMILHSGNARANAYEAIDCLKEKKFEQAKELLKSGKEELLSSQKTHAELLRQTANDENVVPNLLLVHAEDHVSNSEIALDMANELYVVYEILAGRKEY